MNRDKLRQIFGLMSEEEMRETVLNDAINVKEFNGEVFVLLKFDGESIRLPLSIFKSDDVIEVLKEIRRVNL